MKFPKNFLWGAASASYQVEGAAFKDGKTSTIWDSFSATPGKVYAGENGNVSVDQYHRYKEDVALMKELGLASYRFSIAWSRIFPQVGQHHKSNAPNPKGFDYYHALVDELLANGIKPAVTLYHWDLPQLLQDMGGWDNRDIVYYFQEYAAKVFDTLGDRVEMWMPHNEPWCTAILGHLEGVFAPGFKNKNKTYRAIHHLNLSHGLAVQAFRNSKAKKGKIGPALNLYTPSPLTNSAEDALAADRARDRDSRMFLNPLFGKGYPTRHLKAHNIEMPIQGDDMKIIAEKIDFVGINYYTELYAKYNPKKLEQYELGEYKAPTTDMGWTIIPEGLLHVMQFVQKEVGNIDLYVTENGCAAPDVLTPSGVHDYQRISYYRDHLEICSKAIAQGIPLKGYFAWSIIDNFEWAFGYTKRFGLVYCDYKNLSRTRKDSFYKYQQIIRASRA